MRNASAVAQDRTREKADSQEEQHSGDVLRLLFLVTRDLRLHCQEVIGVPATHDSLLRSALRLAPRSEKFMAAEVTLFDQSPDSPLGATGRERTTNPKSTSAAHEQRTRLQP